MKTLHLLCILLIPFLSNGQFNYHNGFGLGYLGTDEGGCAAVGQSGNVHVAGTFETYLDMDPGSATAAINGSGSADVFLAKYASSGALVWAKALLGSSYIAITSIALDTSGNVYVTVFFDGTIDLGGGALNSNGSTDFCVAKFDTDGNHVWSKSFGGTDSEQVNSIKVSGNSIVIGGSFEGTVTIESFTLVSNASAGYSNSLVAAFDTSGNAQWAYGFGRTGFGFDRVNEVAFDNSGNVYATGNFSSTNVDFDPTAGTFPLSSNGSSDIFVTRFNAAGDFQGAFNIGGTTGELAGGIDVAPNGDIYLTGYSNSDSIDVDPQAGTAYLYGDSTILFVQDIIVVKYNFDAEYQWGFRIGRRSSDTGWEINADALGNVFVTGTMGDDSLDFDPGAGTFYLNSTFTFGSTTTFLAQYTSDGDFVDAFNWDRARINDIALSNDGKAWIIGHFDTTALDLDPGAGDATINNAGLDDAFIAAYIYSGQVGINEPSLRSVKAYPVPAGDFVTIAADGNFTGQVDIRDVAGKLVKQVWMESEGRISLEGLKNGVYFISARNNESHFVSKVVKGK